MGLAGIVCLAVPAWHANKYARLVARISGPEIVFSSPAAHTVREEARESLKQLQNQWTVWKSNLLIAGTILAGSSYIITLVAVIVGYFRR